MLQETLQIKQTVSTILRQSPTILNLLFGENTSPKEEDKNHLILPYLYFTGCTNSSGNFLFYETSTSSISRTLQGLRLDLQAICHKDLLMASFAANSQLTTPDILAQLTEETLCNAPEILNLGIGSLKLENTEVFSQDNYYGHLLHFTLTQFR